MFNENNIIPQQYTTNMPSEQDMRYIRDEKKIEKYAHEYADLFFAQMMNSINSPNKENMFDKKIQAPFRHMLNEEFAKVLNDDKSGVNKMIYDSLMKKLQHSQDKAHTLDIKS